MCERDNILQLLLLADEYRVNSLIRLVFRDVYALDGFLVWIVTSFAVMSKREEEANALLERRVPGKPDRIPASSSCPDETRVETGRGDGT